MSTDTNILSLTETMSSETNIIVTANSGKLLRQLPDTGEINNNGIPAALLAGLGGLLIFRRKGK